MQRLEQAVSNATVAQTLTRHLQQQHKHTRQPVTISSSEVDKQPDPSNGIGAGHSCDTKHNNHTISCRIAANNQIQTHAPQSTLSNPWFMYHDLTRSSGLLVVAT
jgi:hypothetical protein